VTLSIFHLVAVVRFAMGRSVCALSLAAALVSGERSEDLVTSLPGFPDAQTWGFEVYSGILEVPSWEGSKYEEMRIHYQFHTSRGSPSSDPIMAWHQGGPGGSSINVGLYSELGAFIIGESGNYINPYGWNRVANMLYLESPAGSGGPYGFSQCISNGTAADCSFDDVSQAEAYAHTLTAFFQAFPEFAQHDLFLAGESYFGQYGPNIAHYILNTQPFSSSINLKGIAAGNACWGGNSTSVDCTGPNADEHTIDLYYGRGLFSPKIRKQISDTCTFPEPGVHDDSCYVLVYQMLQQVGPHNKWNIYDNCPNTQAFLERTGKDQLWLLRTLRAGMHNHIETHAKLTAMNGGYDWDCLGDVKHWITRDDVRRALHLDLTTPGASKLQYVTSGPASVTLWPELARKLRVLVYSGDSDPCVPYLGTEEWVGKLEDEGILDEQVPWTPWFVTDGAAPAGYITRYSAGGSKTDFSFATVRLAGHMVPQFQPEAGLQLLTDFLKGGSAEASMPRFMV